MPAAFADAVARFGAQTALVEASGRSISFSDLAAQADRFAAAAAARGIHPGDRVLVAMPVGIDLYAVLAGLWRLGAVAVFPEPALGLAGLRHAARVTKPAAFAASGPYRWLRFLVPELWRMRYLPPAHPGGALPSVSLPRADDPALISFTSGSTGTPKGIIRSHGFLMAQYAAVAPLLTSDAPQRDLVAFPVFVLVNLAAGRCSVLPNWKLSAQDKVCADTLCDWIGRQQVTRLLLPPALCETLAGAGVPRPVHSIFTGGGPVFPDVVARLREGRSDLRVVSVYGSTEAEPIAELDADDVSAADLRAMQGGAGLLAGTPVPQIALRIVDDEIQVAGAHVNDGYLDPARNAETKLHEGARVWHRTGDAGRLDADGRLWLLGRHAGKAGALYPFAIETAARFWPGVTRAAFCAAPEGEVLFIDGHARHMADWQARAKALGAADVRRIAHIPMDRRHRSKVDYVALCARLRKD